MSATVTTLIVAIINVLGLVVVAYIGRGRVNELHASVQDVKAEVSTSNGGPSIGRIIEGQEDRRTGNPSHS
jgi:hypothetical protein